MTADSFSAEALFRSLRGLTAARRIVVGYSGGMDSHVLLHALMSSAREHALMLAAIHIDHGLHPLAPCWAAHCAQVCREWRVPLRVLRVDARPRRGDSPEQAARRARYRAFATHLQPGQELLTAHTADDQAETVLLRLLRGSGVHGTAGIRVRRALGCGHVTRPLLSFTRAALAAYARRAQLHWVDDPSNVDLRFERNFVRHRVLPLLTERWPASVRTLARDAGQFAAAAAVLDELAAADLARALDDEGALSLPQLHALGAARQDLLLRRWLAHHRVAAPSTVRIHALHRLAQAAPDRQPELRLGAFCVRRYRDRLYLEEGAAPALPHTALRWDLRAPLPLPGRAAPLTRAALEDLGLRLPRAGVEVRFRRGGERIRLAGHAHHKTLKKLFQERGVAPWRRAQVPLIYIDGRLAAVVGIGVAAEFSR